MSAFRMHGRGHLNGPVVVVGAGLLGTSIGLGLRGRGVAVFLSDPSPTNQAVAVDIGAGLPLARLDGEQPELVVVAAPPDVTADVVAKALQDYPDAVPQTGSIPFGRGNAGRRTISRTHHAA